MLIKEYLSNNKFDFVDRVNFSKNKKVIRTICFNKTKDNIVSSGKITIFKEGTFSYQFTNNKLGGSNIKNYQAQHTTLEELGDRLQSAFG